VDGAAARPASAVESRFAIDDLSPCKI